ncbi:ion channel [Novosphingobium sp. PY1]|uniref:ion channel n=1 Tax=Novosphingobium sp. PY1 TaxID=1882221 RepID=UPI001AA4CF08|nr:ion channel [Novosphingobium sp. PY1]GFM28060.1 Kef-type K+ transport system NAD-binding membrane protein [Novosphingobium sp. PY1]
MFLAALWLHLGMIRLARLTVQPASIGSLRLSLAYLIVLASHLLVTGLFAIGFAGSAALGIGGFDKEPAMSAMDLFYFSLINITTLGLGDIYPTGHLRALAGIESLTGFLLISCTAQFVFSTMKKQKE